MVGRRTILTVFYVYLFHVPFVRAIALFSVCFGLAVMQVHFHPFVMANDNLLEVCVCVLFF